MSAFTRNVFKAEVVCVQEVACAPSPISGKLVFCVLHVTDQWMANRKHVDANLVCATRVELQDN